VLIGNSSPLFRFNRPGEKPWAHVRSNKVYFKQPVVLFFGDFPSAGCVRDSSGKPTVRNERGLAANSPTLYRSKKSSITNGIGARPYKFGDASLKLSLA